MHPVGTVLALGLTMAAAQHQHKAGGKSSDNPSTASATSKSMGPAAFMWPPDRVWSGDMDNQPPCGSRAAPGNRTEFPLSTSFACVSRGSIRAWLRAPLPLRAKPRHQRGD